MAWEDELFALLDDLEPQAEAAYDAEREAELADRSRAEYAAVTLASRLMASVGRPVDARRRRRRPGGGPAGSGSATAGCCSRRGPGGQDWVVAAGRRCATVQGRLGALGARSWPGRRSPGSASGSALRRLADAGGALRGAPARREPSRGGGAAGGRDFVEVAVGGGRERAGALRPRWPRSPAGTDRAARAGPWLRSRRCRTAGARRRQRAPALAAGRPARRSSSIASMMCLRTIVRGSRSLQLEVGVLGAELGAQLVAGAVGEACGPGAGTGRPAGPARAVARARRRGPRRRRSPPAPAGRLRTRVRTYWSASGRAAYRPDRGRAVERVGDPARAPGRPARSGRTPRSACRRRRPRAATCRAGSARAPGRRTRTAPTASRRPGSPPPEPKISSRCSGPQCGQGRKLMFSTTPTTRWCIIEAIVPARSATSAAASCGVVTTTTSALGRCWPSEMRDVAGAGRQVEEQHVEVAPVDVGEHLHERPVEHRAAPGDDLVAARLEHADRDHRDARRASGPA